MYGQYLRALLEPLRVYDLSPGTLNDSAIEAEGAAFDRVESLLEYAEREALTATAEGEGLSRRETLFARKPAAFTPKERRRALEALLQIDGDSLTPGAINRTICGCGIKAQAQEMGGGHLRVIFPEVAGIPPEFDQIREIILDILPCHLEVEFYFRYLTWDECQRAGYIWNGVETAGHTWKSFELAVPPTGDPNSGA